MDSLRGLPGALAQYRERKNLTIAQLCKKVGVSERSHWKINKGSERVRLDVMQGFADVLECTLDDIANAHDLDEISPATLIARFVPADQRSKQVSARPITYAAFYQISKMDAYLAPQWRLPHETLNRKSIEILKDIQSLAAEVAEHVWDLQNEPDGDFLKVVLKHPEQESTRKIRALLVEEGDWEEQVFFPDTKVLRIWPIPKRHSFAEELGEIDRVGAMEDLFSQLNDHGFSIFHTRQSPPDFETPNTIREMTEAAIPEDVKSIPGLYNFLHSEKLCGSPEEFLARFTRDDANQQDYFVVHRNTHRRVLVEIDDAEARLKSLLESREDAP